MSELEVTKVGETLSQHFLDQLSASINLPAETCKALLKAGWTLEVSQHQPAMWVQAWPKELRK